MNIHRYANPELVEVVRSTLERADPRATQRNKNFTFRNRFEHCLRVASIAGEIALAEGLDPEVAVLAGLFHDAGKASGRDHGEVGAELAGESLRRHGLAIEKLEIVVDCIRHHSSYVPHEKGKYPEHLAVLRDADVLDESGAMGIAWTLMGLVGSDLQSYLDGLAGLAQKHNPERFEASVQRMRTATGRKMMQERTDRELKFISDFEEELRKE